jgi:hypothetical protein
MAKMAALDVKGVMSASARHVADHVFVQAEDVALAVCEPGSLLVASEAHVVDGLDLRRVVVQEAHAALRKVLDLVGDVLDPKVRTV